MCVCVCVCVCVHMGACVGECMHKRECVCDEVRTKRQMMMMRERLTWQESCNWLVYLGDVPLSQPEFQWHYLTVCVCMRACAKERVWWGKDSGERWWRWEREIDVAREWERERAATDWFIQVMSHWVSQSSNGIIQNQQVLVLQNTQQKQQLYYYINKLMIKWQHCSKLINKDWNLVFSSKYKVTVICISWKCEEHSFFSLAKT